MLTTLGKDQWIKFSRDIIRTTRELAREVDKIPGVKVMGNPEELICAVAIELDPEYFRGKRAPNVHSIADELLKRLGKGASLQYVPEGFHLTVANNHTSSPEYINNFKKHLRQITATIDPNVEPTSSVGSAYLQMGKVTVFGFPVFPRAVSRKLADNAMNSIYDFHPKKGKDEAEKKTEVTQEKGINMVSFIFAFLGALLLFFGFKENLQRALNAESVAPSAMIQIVAGVTSC